MTRSTDWFTENVRDKEGVLVSSKYFYGSRYRDHFLLRDNESLPLYGRLGRKLLMHYAAEHYNPHTIGINHEPRLRGLIKQLVEYKVSHRLKEYDWEWIDHYFKKTIGEFYDLNLPYDQARIDAGFAPQYRPAMEYNYKRPN